MHAMTPTTTTTSTSSSAASLKCRTYTGPTTPSVSLHHPHPLPSMPEPTHKREPSMTAASTQPLKPLLSSGINSDPTSRKRKIELELSSSVDYHHHKRKSSQLHSKSSSRVHSGFGTSNHATTDASKKPCDIRLSGRNVVYFSPTGTHLPTESPANYERGNVQSIRFEDTEDECTILLRGVSGGTLKPLLYQPSADVHVNDSIAILPVGGPDSGFVSPYTYSLDKPLTISVSSGTLSGLGMFAKRPIRQGTVILVERPVLIVSDVEDAEGVFVRMKENTRRYMECMRDATAATRTDEKVAGAKTPQGIVKTNGFAVELEFRDGDKQSCKAVFLQSARCNHCCGPSAIPIFNSAALTLTLYANRDLQPGDEITIPYIPVSSSTTSIPVSPPTTPPTSLGHFRSSSPSFSEISSTTSTISSLLSSTSSNNTFNIPPIYLPRHSRRRLLHENYNFECRCEYCDIPWNEVDGVHKSDRTRKELALYNLALADPFQIKLRKKLVIPTYQEWCGDSRIPRDALINTHLRLLEARRGEGLELTGLAHPGLQSETLNVREEGWLKHVDALGMCFGALGDKKEFRRWVGTARDVRWAMVHDYRGGDREQIEHVKVLDTWLDEPKLFPLWGWRVLKDPGIC